MLLTRFLIKKIKLVHEVFPKVFAEGSDNSMIISMFYALTKGH